MEIDVDTGVELDVIAPDVNPPNIEPEEGGPLTGGTRGNEKHLDINLFQVCLKERLDGKVVEGMDVVRKMEAVGSEDGYTSKPVIKNCEMAK